MANRFWVGGTGTWNNSNTTSWSTTSSGGGGASVPGTSDVAIFDGSSGGGTVTVDSPNGAGVVTVQGITMGAFTGTLDFATNDNAVTWSGTVSLTGTGSRTLNMGDGTWTCTAGASATTVWDATTTTNLTFNKNAANIVFSATPAANRQFIGGGLTYNNLTVTNGTAASGSRLFSFTTAATFNNLTFTNCRYILMQAATTITVSGTLSYDGASTSFGVLTTNTGVAGTISVANANTLNYLVIGNITKSGAGSITANDSYDMGNNTSVTINNPTGGTAGARVIGG